MCQLVDGQALASAGVTHTSTDEVTQLWIRHNAEHYQEFDEPLGLGVHLTAFITVPSHSADYRSGANMGVSLATISQLRDGRPTVGVPEACELLGISRSHGYDAVRRGVFPARVLRVGRSYRVVSSSLLQLLDGGAA